MNDCMQGVVTALDALAGVSSAAAPSAPDPAANLAPLQRQHSDINIEIQGQRIGIPGGAVTDIEVDNTMALRRTSSSPPAYMNLSMNMNIGNRSSPAPPSAKRPRTSSRMRFLRSRELDMCGDTVNVPEELRTWIEGETLRKLDTGEYVSLDKNAERVRSTISIALSHDGKYFASTHGDHSVKVFEYPSRNQIACLDGHPRTPWTVCFHPNNSNLVASGCLGSECRVWDVKAKKCVRKHTFRGSISCVSFNPTGELLAVTSGKSLLLWNYKHPTPNGGISSTAPLPPPQGAGAGNNAGAAVAYLDGNPNENGNSNPNINADAQNEGRIAMATPLNQHLPVELLAGSNPFHMVDFHPSGHMLMTGEKNKNITPPPNQGNNAQNSNAEEPPAEEQFTLKIIVHRFDRRMGVKFARPVLVVPRVVAYNDAGIHFSPCGKMLAACVPVSPNSHSFHIAVLSIYPGANGKVGSVLYKSPLDKGHVTALTNLKFSSTSKHLLAGFSFRPQNPVLRIHAEQYGEMAMAAGRLPGRSGNGNNGGRNGQEFLPCGAPIEPRLPQVRVVDIYRVDKAFKRIRSLGADVDITENNGGAEDEINVAVFAPRDGLADGIIYGTQKGRIRMFQQASGRKRYPSGICDENCTVDNPKHRLPYLLQPINMGMNMNINTGMGIVNNAGITIGNLGPNVANNGSWRQVRNHAHAQNMGHGHGNIIGQMHQALPLPLPRIAHPPLPHPPFNNTHNYHNMERPAGRAQSTPPPGAMGPGVFLDASYRRQTAWQGTTTTTAGAASSQTLYSLHATQGYRFASGRQGRSTAMAQPSMMISQNILPPINIGRINQQDHQRRQQEEHHEEEEHGRL